MKIFKFKWDKKQKVSKALHMDFPKAYWWGMLTIIVMLSSNDHKLIQISSTLFLFMGIFSLKRNWDD